MYPSLPRSTPPPFRDLVRCLRIPESTPPPPPRILFNKFICATLPESTPPSQNILFWVWIPQYTPFSKTIILCVAPRIYPSLPEYTLLFKNNYMPYSQNLPLPPRIYPLFNKFICATLPESIPPSQNMPPFQQLYATLPESTFSSHNIPTFSINLYVPPSQNLLLPPRIYPPFQQLYVILPESTPPSQNIPSFQQL